MSQARRGTARLIGIPDAPEGYMVLLVLGIPVLVLVLALALESLETNLLPTREADPSDRDDWSGAAAFPHSDLHPPGVTSGPSHAL